MITDMRVLTLKHFGNDQSEDLEITLCPMTIKMIAAKDVHIQGRDVKATTILFMDDAEPVTLNLSGLDLISLQNVVGAYSFFDGN